MPAVFKMIHTWTHAEGTNAKKKEKTPTVDVWIEVTSSDKCNGATCPFWEGKHARMCWRRSFRSYLGLRMYPHINDKSMIICLHPIWRISVLSLNVTLPLQGPWCRLFLPNYRSKILLFEEFAVKRKDAQTERIWKKQQQAASLSSFL